MGTVQCGLIIEDGDEVIKSVCVFLKVYKKDKYDVAN